MLFWGLFIWMALSGDTARALLPFSLAPLLAILIGHPHYGATLLRVYEHRADRQRYVYFAVFGSGLIWALFAVGVHVAAVGSLLLTIYVMVAPWHYAGQNYGIAVMLMRRRGAEISRPAQRFFHATFVLSTLFTIVALHGPVPPAAETAFYYGAEYNFMSIGMSAVTQNVVVASLAVLYLASLIGSAVLLKRKATFSQLIPAAAMSVTQALWFSVPKLASHFGLFGDVAPFSAQHAAYMFFWVSVGHSIQYLWVTTYFAERAEHPTRRVPFYAKTILAGAAVFAVPALIFAPDIMGRYSLDGGLLVMISTVVNLHHYLLDAVIWKLRQGPIADVLIRSQAAQQDGLEPESGWVRTALVSVGVLSVLVMSVEMVSIRSADRAVAQRDAVALSSSIGILAMIQHPRASLYHSLAQIQKRRGDMTAAIESAERAQRLHYDFKYSSHLCFLLAFADRMSEATDVCRTIVNDRPDDSQAAMFLAAVLVRDPERTAETVDEAIAIAEAASAARGDDPRFLEALAAVYGKAGREDAKRRTAERALEIATARNDQALVDKLQALIDTPASELATE